ncbi:MAG TPA: hypothetical protein VIP27_12585 [Variovorax sp.]
MNSKPIRVTALRYQRAYGFTVDALHTLCCATGGMKDRLQQIDQEFFSISTNELPEVEELRSKFTKLHELVTSKEARYPHEGRIFSTLDQLHHTKLKSIAQQIWEIHVEFLAFMQKNDMQPC